MSKPDNVTSIAHLRGKVDETGQTVTIQAPRKRRRKRGWRDHVSLIDVGLMTRLELNGTENRVLMAVMSNVPEKGGAEAFCTMADIAAQLQIAVSSVNRAMQALQKRHIVFKRRQGRWHVNTWLMYNGDFDSWNVDADADPEPIWVRGVDATTGEVR